MNRQLHSCYQLRIISRVVVVILLFFSTALQAQDFKRPYARAKALFENGNYSDAIDAFKPLTVYNRGNTYLEYANFYTALSAYRLGYINLAKETLLDIQKIYPKWNQSNEVTFWLIKIYFDQQEYFRALALAKKIKNPTLRKEVDLMKRAYFAKLNDVETMKMLREENPTDNEVLRGLAVALGKNLYPENEDLLEEVAKLLGANKNDFINTPQYKEKYRVALLLPFRANILDASPGRKKSQFVLDLYQGMKLANDSLSHEGIQLELLAYDTEHDPNVIRKLVSLEELKSADIFVGPLFQEDAKPIHELSIQNSINTVINPISVNIDMVGVNPNAFLFQPSHATIGIKSAEIAKTVSNKNCVVFFGANARDSVMAFNFIRKAKEIGVKVVHSEKVYGSNSAKLLDELATPTLYDEWKNPKQFTMKRDSIGSIFVASDDALIYTKIINSVESRGDSILVIGQESWLEDDAIDFDKLEENKIILSSPNYVSTTDRAYLQFQKKYISTHGVLPSTYAQKGYEFVMCIGHAFKKYGVFFQEGLTAEKMNGVIGRGYHMQPTKDNAVVPFVSFRNNRLVIVREP